MLKVLVTGEEKHQSFIVVDAQWKIVLELGVLLIMTYDQDSLRK